MHSWVYKQFFHSLPCTMHISHFTVHIAHCSPKCTRYLSQTCTKQFAGQSQTVSCTLYAFQMESLRCKLKSKPQTYSEPGSWRAVCSKIGWWALMVNCRPDWSSDSTYNARSFVGQTRFLPGFTFNLHSSSSELQHYKVVLFS